MLRLAFWFLPGFFFLISDDPTRAEKCVALAIGEMYIGRLSHHATMMIIDGEHDASDNRPHKRRGGNPEGAPHDSVLYRSKSDHRQRRL
jgi:hypothetical protein